MRMDHREEDGGGGGDSKASGARRAYLGTLVHALNQPLTAIGSYLEGGRTRLTAQTDPLLREALEAAADQSRRAIRLAREVAAALGRRPAEETLQLSVNEDLEAAALDLPVETDTRVRLELDRAVGPAVGSSFALRRVVPLLVRHAAEGLGRGGGWSAVLRSAPGGREVHAEIVLSREGLDAGALGRYVQGCVGDPLIAVARSAIAEDGAVIDTEALDGPCLRFRIRLTAA